MRTPSSRAGIHAVIKKHPGRDYVFLASTTSDDAGSIAELLSWANNLNPPRLTRVVPGKDIVEWALRWYWVAADFLPVLRQEVLVVPTSPTTRVPTNPIDAREQVLTAVAPGREVHVVGPFGLGQRHLARELAITLTEPGGPGAVEVATSDAGALREALRMYPDESCVVVLPPGPELVALLRVCRDARPEGQALVFPSPQQHHQLRVGGTEPPVCVDLAPVPDGEVRALLLAWHDWHPGEVERRVRDARGRAGLVLDWIEGRAEGQADQESLFGLDERERAVLALIAAYSPVDRPTWVAIAERMGVPEPVADRTIEKLVARNVAAGDDLDTVKVTDLDIATLLPRLVDPDFRPGFQRALTRDPSARACLRTLWYLDDPVTLRTAAAETPGSTEFASEVTGNDEVTDATLLSALAKRSAARREREYLASIVARASAFPANAASATRLVAALSVHLPSGVADRIAQQLVDPWRTHEPAAVFRALAETLEDVGTIDLAERAARVWLASGARCEWSDADALHLGTSSWNELSPFVADTREAVLDLAATRRRSASVPVQVKGWGLAHAIWMPAGLLSSTPMPDRLVQACEGMLAEVPAALPVLKQRPATLQALGGRHHLHRTVTR